MNEKGQNLGSGGRWLKTRPPMKSPNATPATSRAPAAGTSRKATPPTKWTAQGPGRRTRPATTKTPTGRSGSGASRTTAANRPTRRTSRATSSRRRPTAPATTWRRWTSDTPRRRNPKRKTPPTRPPATGSCTPS